MAPGPKLNPGGVEIHQTDAFQPAGGALTHGCTAARRAATGGRSLFPPLPRRGEPSQLRRGAPQRPTCSVPPGCPLPGAVIIPSRFTPPASAAVLGDRPARCQKKAAAVRVRLSGRRGWGSAAVSPGSR